MKKWHALVLLLLAACAGSSNPAKAVEDYFQALVDKDATKAIGVSCAAWESGAQTDVDTFSMVPTKLENLACRESGSDGEYKLIECTGKAILDYNGELQEIDLSARVYKVIQEGGEWRMCGYK
jgi:hypothetical protein